MNTNPLASPSAGRPHAPLDCLRNRPEILDAIGKGISHAGYLGSRTAQNTFVPSNGPGLVTYVELNGQIGPLLIPFGVRKFEAKGINNLVLPETDVYPEVRLVFSQGFVAGERALLNEKRPCAMDLLKNNRGFLGLNLKPTGALRLLDMAEDAQLDLGFPTFLSVWVIWKRHLDRMDAWLIVPVYADEERRRLEFYDMEALGAFPHAELPEQVIQQAMQPDAPQATPAVFNIEEKPDEASGTSG